MQSQCSSRPDSRLKRQTHMNLEKDGGPAYGFELFNAADDLLLHNLAAGRGDRMAGTERDGARRH